MAHPFKHLHTIGKHRRQVIRNASHMGIFWHALKHDVSKMSHREFNLSAKYFDGHRSPVLGEREENDNFSLICQHHTKRNPHHWEYWTDFYKGDIIVRTMPYIYAVEYVCDMLSASKTYNPKTFKPDTALNYFKSRCDHYYITRATKEFVLWCLTQYAESGWKNLCKKATKAKYDEITAKYQTVETIKELRNKSEGEILC